MGVPRYDVRAGWLAGNWTEIGCKYPTWGIVADAFRWEELQAGPVPDVDVEELSIHRKVGTIIDRLSVGECRAQLANGQGQYTGIKSAQNLFAYSDNIASGTYWVTANGATSLAMLTGKTFAIDAATFAEDSATGPHRLRSPASVQVINSVANITICGEFYPGSRDRFELGLTDPTSAHGFLAQFSIRSMTVVAGPTATNSATALAASLQQLSDGWVRCWVAGTLPGSLAVARMDLVNSAGVNSYAGTGSAWVGVRALQAHQGALYPIDYLATAGEAVVPRGTELTVNDVFCVKAAAGTWDATSTTLTVQSVYSLFSGYLDEWGFNPALQDLRKLALSASDVANRLRPIVTTSMMVNVTHHTIAQAIMSEANFDALQYTIDPMNDQAQFAWIDQLSAGEALSTLQQNGAQVYFVDGRGRLRIKSRHHDVTSTAAVASYAVAFKLELALGVDDVINRIEVRTAPRRLVPIPSTIAWLSNPVYVPAQSTASFILDFYDYLTNETGVPAMNFDAQVKGVDFLAHKDPDAQQADITSAFNIAASLSATAAHCIVSNNGIENGYVTVCQFVGQQVTRQPELVKSIRDDASIARYTERYASVNADLLNTINRCTDLADFLLIDRKEPRVVTNLALKNEWPHTYQLDILDRIFLSNSLSRVNSSFYITEIEHTLVMSGGTEHTLSMKLDLAPIKNWFTLDSPTLGRLDFNLLGY
ncbi:MAG: hypothetical protein HC889_00725 [Synechococcaceae cyanobacterium SM1_2_3]|nr:hypothetical protein [Synechococcaceae cyanobacterium SM1_2_3]